MSRSDRDPGGNEVAAIPGNACLDVPYPFFVSFLPVPAVVRSVMRTVDAVALTGAARKQEADSSFLVRRAAAVIEQLELAITEGALQSRGAGLFFHEGGNEVTGEPGVIVRRAIGPGLYTRALAELLVPAGEVTQAREAADLFGSSAANRDLLIFVYADSEGSFPRPAAFAAIKRPDEPGSSRLLARLLVTSFEASQWSDPRLELAGLLDDRRDM